MIPWPQTMMTRCWKMSITISLESRSLDRTNLLNSGGTRKTTGGFWGILYNSLRLSKLTIWTTEGGEELNRSRNLRLSIILKMKLRLSISRRLSKLRKFKRTKRMIRKRIRRILWNWLTGQDWVRLGRRKNPIVVSAWCLSKTMNNWKCSTALHSRKRERKTIYKTSIFSMKNVLFNGSRKSKSVRFAELLSKAKLDHWLIMRFLAQNQIRVMLLCLKSSCRGDL